MARNLDYARQFDPYAKDVTLEELQQVRRQLAKVMNQRMVRLENTKSPITGESYDFGAYDLMEDYLQKQNRNRFSEVLKPTKGTGDERRAWNKAELQKEIKKLQRFEELKSSRVGGMHEIEAARIKTLTTADSESGRKTALSEEVVKSKDFYDFLNSSTFDDLMEDFDSEDIVEEYNKAADRGVSHEQIVTALNTYLKKARKASLKGIRRKLRAIKVKGSSNAKSSNKKSGRKKGRGKRARGR